MKITEIKIDVNFLQGFDQHQIKFFQKYLTTAKIHWKTQFIYKNYVLKIMF